MKEKDPIVYHDRGSAGGKRRRRLLAVRGGALGDFILTLPALKALAGQGYELELLTRSAYGRLAQDFGWANHWRSLDSVEAAALTLAGSNIDQDWRGWLGTFDAVVSWVPDPDGAFQFQIRQCGVPVFCQGDWRCAAPEPAARQLARVDLLAENTGPPPFGLFEHLPVRPVVDPHLIALHPGSGSPRKNWPLDHWITVMRHLRKMEPGLCFRLITGEAEEERLPAIRQAMDASGLPWESASGLELTALARSLAECRALLGHDSGISHLAAACGVPCYLIFGPTDPAVWAPQGEHVRVLRAPGGALPGLEPEKVREWLDQSGFPVAKMASEARR